MRSAELLSIPDTEGQAGAGRAWRDHPGGWAARIIWSPAADHGDVRAARGLDFVEEGRFDGGKWIAGRKLNGDEETHQGRHVRLPPGQFGIPEAQALLAE